VSSCSVGSPVEISAHSACTHRDDSLVLIKYINPKITHHTQHGVDWLHEQFANTMLCRRSPRILAPRDIAQAFQAGSISNAHRAAQSQLSAVTSHQRRSASSSTTTATAPSSDANPKVIFSGIQPTGVPHLGNYLGALSQWAALQEEATAAAGQSGTTTRLLFSVVDLHAITMPQDASQLRLWRRQMLAALLAVGLDPSRSTIFHQSSVPAHAELMWVLSCTASMGYLSRMTQWKSKMSLPEDASALPGDDGHVGGGIGGGGVGNKSSSSSSSAAALKLGLFSYPVLQAADILVHRATHVPVGEDQRQHLEFARECASGFNHTYGTGTGTGRGTGTGTGTAKNRNILVAPETIVSPARRVMSLTDPTKKMSKSDANAASRVLITDAAQDIRRKIMRAVTDSQSGFVSYDPEARPGVSNLLEILAILEGCRGGNKKNRTTTPGEVARGFEGSQHPLKALKERTADAVAAELRDVRERYLELMGANGGRGLDDLEALGAEKARQSADATMKLVKEAVGF
jgi:tryptophanyl-tRNA synthetase